MKKERNCGKKEKRKKTFEKKNETPRAVLKYRKNTTKGKKQKSLFKRASSRRSLSSLSLYLSLLLVFDFTTIQTTIDTDDAQEERETTGITRQKERAD